MELAHKSGINGHIYNDIDGMADVSEKVGIENALVSLYDQNGRWIDSIRTDVDGAYQLFVEEGNYSIVVDSKSLSSSENVWMEQTYAPKGGLCSDGNGSTKVPLELAGVCYGGKRGNYDDDNSSLEDAEHVAHISVSNEAIEDMDFGFSSNVVVNTEDSGQGSLRQFIKNANEIDGANVMKFTPAVAKNEVSWWSITLDSPLPALTDAGTIIDGATGNDENSGQVVHAHDGEEVGTNEIALPSFNKPELEINANDMASENGVFVIEADDMTIKHIALYNAPSDSRVGVLISSGENNKIIENFIGSRADGSEPEESNRLKNAIYHDSANAVQITHNFIAYIDFTGIWANNNAYIANNSLYRASNLPLGDAITTEISAGENIIIENNRIEGASSYGIESWNSPSVVTIRNNTLIANGQDISSANKGENGGIRVFGNNNTIKNNVIKDHVGAGIVITGGKKGNTISQNAIYNNGGLGIDIDLTSSGNANGDGVTVNNGTLDADKANNEMDYPVFTSATISGNSLHVKGYIGTQVDQAAFDGSKVEVFIADDNSSDVSDVNSLRDDDGSEYIVHGEGKYYLGACSTVGNGNFNCSFTVPNDLNLTNESIIVATATGSDKSTSEFGANMVVSDAPTGTFTPLVCDSTLYLSNSTRLGVGSNTSDMYLHSIDISVNPFLFSAIGNGYNKTYNALAYNVEDDYLYALYGGLLIRIDKDGDVQEVGDIEGITQQHYSGTFDKEGYYYVGNWGDKSEILKIDIEKRQIVSKISLGSSREYWDMTISNDGAYLYFVNVDNGKFTKVNLSDSTVTEVGGGYNNGHNEVSSIYSDIDNRLFIILNGGGFYEIDVDTGVRYFISNSPELSGLNDGANCPNASLSFYDLGDAPESYGIAEHRIIQSLKVGNLVDHEQNASKYFSLEASADNESGENDENSIDTEILNTLSQMMQHFSLSVNVINKTGVPTTLKGWIDFDGNGVFDSDEEASVSVADSALRVTLNWNVTSDIEAGKSYLRLRLSEQDNIESTGSQTLGEVEDYTFNIKPRPILDAWDRDLSITNKVIKTKKTNEDIILSVASLTPSGDAFESSAFKTIETALFAKVGNTSEALSAWKAVDLSDRNITDITFGKVNGAYKNAYVAIKYEDDFNVTREINSSDIFAIRPDSYKLNIPTNLVAGKDFNITIKAIDVDGATIENYEELSSVYQLDINETKAASGCSLGDVDIKEKRAFINGESIVTINYNEIGDLQFDVREINTTTSEFAQLDEDDGSADTRFISNDTDTSNDINPAKIRAVYNYEAINNLPYTYYSNNPNTMGVKFDVNLTVMNDSNETVTNYTVGCYAKDIDIALNFEQTGDTSTAIFSDELGVNQNNIDLNTTGFKYSVYENSFLNGVSGRSLRINFSRAKNIPKVPLNFKINESNAKINGSNIENNGNLDKTITFIYARAHAPMQQTIVGATMNARVQYEVYLPNGVDKALYGMDGLSEGADSIDWDILPADSAFGYKAGENPENRFLGVTVGGFDSYNIPLTATKIPHSNRIIYTPKDYLLYNRWNSSATTHSFQVQFFNNSEQWEGKGAQGLTVGKEGLRRGNMKMDW
jgi:hypothetical protein